MSSFFNKIKGALSGQSSVKAAVSDTSASPETKEFDTLLAKINEETLSGTTQWVSRVKLSDSLAWENLKKNGSPDTLMALALYCVTLQQDQMQRRNRTHGEGLVLATIYQQILRKKLDYPRAYVDALFDLVLKYGGERAIYASVFASVIGVTEKHLNGQPADEALAARIRDSLRGFEPKNLGGSMSQDKLKLKTRLENLLVPPAANTGKQLPKGAWLDACRAALEGRTEKQKAAWENIFAHALTSAGKSKPTKKWLKQADELLKALGRPRFAAQAKDWFNIFKPDPGNPDLSLEIAKGLIWMVPLLRQDALTLALGRATESSYKKVTGIGARSKKHGNAGVIALSLMDGDPMAVAELVRLKAQVKYPTVKADIHKKLEAVAAKLGVNVTDLEESSLPDFGLDEESLAQVELGDVSALIGLEVDGARLSWTGADGKARKTVPASVKRDFAPELKALKQRVKDITAAQKTQIKRLEESWVEGREWSAPDWQSRFVEHPLRRGISKALVWRLQAGDMHTDVMIDGNGLRTLDGSQVDLDGMETVKLWHPLDTTPDEVLAWRRKIVANELTQPIKQAYREVYVLTDAERNTDIYSNRFAAHILRQHQFRALCQARGWEFDFLGGWDSWSVPTRQIPAQSISIEYHVEAIENDERSEAYVPLHLSTDQVRFIDDEGQQMRLEAVPPIVFSELLRDVDLFVAVTSVANDPEWADGGPEGRHGGYWNSYAFGELGQTAQTRRDLLQELVPKLAISNQLRVTEKFLEVDGKRHGYRIHLGSSNIQIMPSNRYLCIVRGRSRKDDAKVKLPFTGDNMLAIILSKAFLLVDDDKITDKAIRSQLVSV